MKLKLYILLILFIFISTGFVNPCTSFVLKTDNVLLLAKNLDWPVGNGFISINKRNILKTAFYQSNKNPVKWISCYGSITLNMFGREFPLGGINEKGLVIEELSSPESKYPEKDERPEINEFQWIQYQLDKHSTVREVINSNKNVRISKLFYNLHYFVCDRSGNSAVIEFINGRFKYFCGNRLPVAVLSNNLYNDSLRYLKLINKKNIRINNKAFGSQERFIIAYRLLNKFRKNINPIDFSFKVLKKVRQKDTQWSLIFDIKNLKIYYKTRKIKKIKTLKFSDFDYSCKSPTLVININNNYKKLLKKYFSIYDSSLNKYFIYSTFTELKNKNLINEIPDKEFLKKMYKYPETLFCLINSENN